MDLGRITLEIAQKKIDNLPSTDKVHRPRLGTGGGFEDVFFWDTAFICLWAKYFPDKLPVYTSLDNLYRLADTDGYICRQYLPIGEPKWFRSHPDSYSPPLLAWAELEIFELHGDRDRLVEVYPKLQRFHDSFRKMFRMEDGLFISSVMGCGMDNLPRWPRGWKGDDVGQKLTPDDIHPSFDLENRKRKCNWFVRCWNYQARWIDASCQAAFDSLCMKRIAQLLDDSVSADQYAQEQEELKQLINERCWNEEDSFYFDIMAEGDHIRRFHVGAYWALLAEICPPEKVERFAAHLTDPTRFGRTTPVPSLSADDPDYDPKGDYWRGSSWPPTTYMTLRGLKEVGLSDVAKELGEKYLAVVTDVLEETGTLWENYAPDLAAPGSLSAGDFVGWTGLASICVPREILNEREGAMTAQSGARA